MNETELKIMDAARAVFIRKGFDGARMQEIADEAQINKAMLHYYFRSKEKLFEEIFDRAFATFVPSLLELTNQQLSIEQKVELMIDSYLDMLTKNPYLPNFILQEINRNRSDWFPEFLRKRGIVPEQILEPLTESLFQNGNLNFDPRHLIVNIIAMCVFPFAARPMLKGFLFSQDDQALDDFLTERKTVIKHFAIQALKNKPQAI
jgi:TetR/AcrR family transcriptional regulator